MNKEDETRLFEIRFCEWRTYGRIVAGNTILIPMLCNGEIKSPGACISCHA